MMNIVSFYEACHNGSDKHCGNSSEEACWNRLIYLILRRAGHIFGKVIFLIDVLGMNRHQQISMHEVSFLTCWEIW